MQTIEIHTEGPEAGKIKLPMRRVDGLLAWKCMAWIELATLLGEWPTDTTQGLSPSALAGEASDDELSILVQDRLLTVPGTGSVDAVEVTRSGSEVVSLVINATYGDTAVVLGVAT